MPVSRKSRTSSPLRFSMVTMLVGVTIAALISATARWSPMSALLLALVAIAIGSADYALQVAARRRLENRARSKWWVIRFLNGLSRRLAWFALGIAIAGALVLAYRYLGR